MSTSGYRVGFLHGHQSMATEAGTVIARVARISAGRFAEVAMGLENASPAGAGSSPPPVRNAVRLQGRVCSGPLARQLPSGTTIVTVRLSVPRDKTPMAKGSKQTSDWVDCTAWSARARRALARCGPGDVVEVDGALRRRFSRGEPGMSTRLEVEVLGARLVSRARRDGAG